MNRTAFSLPDRSEYRTRGGLAVTRSVEQFTGDAKRLDDLIDLLDRRRGVVLSSGTTVPGRYESFDLGFSDPPLQLETRGADFSLQALNARGEVLIAFLGDALREPCVVIAEKSAKSLKGHIVRGAAPDGRADPARSGVHEGRDRDRAYARIGIVDRVVAEFLRVAPDRNGRGPGVRVHEARRYRCGSQGSQEVIAAIASCGGARLPMVS